MTVAEGDANTTITTSELSATDADSTDVNLSYTVEDVSNGTLTINGSVWASGSNDTFTQQDIIDGDIQYAHDDSNTTSDSFSFSVTDGTNTLSSQTFSINVMAVDDDVVAPETTILPEDKVELNDDPTIVIISSDSAGENDEVLVESDPQLLPNALTEANTSPDEISEPVTFIDQLLGQFNDESNATTVASEENVKNTDSSKSKHQNKSSVKVAYIPLSQLLGGELANQSLLDTISTDEIDTQQENNLWQKIDLINQAIDQNKSENNHYDIEAEVIIGSTIGVTAGIVSWVLRGGSLLVSFMSTLPLLASLDPLPILKVKSNKHNPRAEKQNEKKPRNKRLFENITKPLKSDNLTNRRVDK
jgi:hypothetical protein